MKNCVELLYGAILSYPMFFKFYYLRLGGFMLLVLLPPSPSHTHTQLTHTHSPHRTLSTLPHITPTHIHWHEIPWSSTPPTGLLPQTASAESRLEPLQASRLQPSVRHLWQNGQRRKWWLFPLLFSFLIVLFFKDRVFFVNLFFFFCDKHLKKMSNYIPKESELKKQMFSTTYLKNERH